MKIYSRSAFLIIFLLNLFVIKASFALEDEFQVQICDSSENNQQYDLLYKRGLLTLINSKTDILHIQKEFIHHTKLSEDQIRDLQKAVDVYMHRPKKVIDSIIAFAPETEKKVGLSIIEFIDGEIHLTLFDGMKKVWTQFSTEFCH